jgi:hypothetical protein
MMDPGGYTELSARLNDPGSVLQVQPTSYESPLTVSSLLRVEGLFKPGEIIDLFTVLIHIRAGAV